MLREQSAPGFYVRESIIGKQVLNPLLTSVGRPINEAACTQEIRQGDPLYLISTLPFPSAFPELYEISEDRDRVERAFFNFQEDIANFYASQSGISVPIWILDEDALAQKRDQLVAQVASQGSSRIVFSTDRERVQADDSRARLDINRVIAIDDDGNLLRDDRPALRAQRPNSPLVSSQLATFSQTYGHLGKSFLLEDAGFASGGSVNATVLLLKQYGMTIDKVIGNVGWYPKAWEQLAQFDPECLIWFDLEKGGWVEDRDFLLLPQSGILVGENDLQTGETILFQRNLDNDEELPICFTLPDVNFEGRWFRISDQISINTLREICIRNTLDILDAIKPNITIGELARLYRNAGSVFSLPVQFGNLNSQLTKINSSTSMADYLTTNFT